MSSSKEALTHIRELEELKEVIQQDPGWPELSKMTKQPDHNLETFVNKADLPWPSSQAPLSLARCHQGLALGHAAGRAGQPASKQQETAQ